MKFAAWPAPFALVALLAACNPSPSVDPAAPETTVAEPDTKPGLALAGGKLVLPAVKGNPGAVYFTLTNASTKSATLAAVDVAGAGMAMLHETTQMDGHSSMQDMKDPLIKPGETLVLAPGGKHVMVDGIPAQWQPGGTVELTLTFSDGDKLSAPVTLTAPGGA
jgi:hypothetical protein